MDTSPFSEVKAPQHRGTPRTHGSLLLGLLLFLLAGSQQLQHSINESVDPVDLPPVDHGGPLQQQAGLREVDHRAGVFFYVPHAGLDVVLEGLVDVDVERERRVLDGF